jgi:cob(I)alamin adenosyltransferase
MKIYTKTGDDGTTGLYGGGRVSKASARIECYGTVDELNSVLGMTLSRDCSPECRRYLTTIQHTLFVLGADLATPNDSKASVDRIEEHNATQLEQWIDELDARLEPLKNFILPGGTESASTLHVARTVCRRAERLCVGAHEVEDLGDAVVHYLNRLSDFLFMLARWENQAAGLEDTPWITR